MTALRREAGAGDGLAARYEELRHAASSNATGGGSVWPCSRPRGWLHWMPAWRQFDVAREPPCRPTGWRPTDGRRGGGARLHGAGVSAEGGNQ